MDVNISRCACVQFNDCRDGNEMRVSAIDNMFVCAMHTNEFEVLVIGFLFCCSSRGGRRSGSTSLGWGRGQLIAAENDRAHGRCRAGRE